MILKNSLSHLQQGKPGMVDVGEKSKTKRTALAQAYILIPKALGDYLKDGEFMTPKGPVFHTAIIAGTMAAKNTAALIPFCHPLEISSIKFDINLDTLELISIQCLVASYGKTGVEMEALTGASVAALTIYDMCKSYSTDLVISDLSVVQKTGGKRDFTRIGTRRRSKLKDGAAQSASLP